LEICWSEKVVDYYSSEGLWVQQIGDLFREVVHTGDAAASSSSSSSSNEPVALVGNSLGGYV
jgi:hypothetical protein